MTKLVLTVLAGATLAASACAAPLAQQMRFTRDGVTYVASVTDRATARYISGYEQSSGRHFSLRVAKGYVTGTFDGHEVAYPVPAALTVSTASR